MIYDLVGFYLFFLFLLLFRFFRLHIFLLLGLFASSCWAHAVSVSVFVYLAPAPALCPCYHISHINPQCLLLHNVCFFGVLCTLLFAQFFLLVLSQLDCFFVMLTRFLLKFHSSSSCCCCCCCWCLKYRDWRWEMRDDIVTIYVCTHSQCHR